MEHHAIASGAQMDLYLTSRAFGKNGGRLFARLPPSVKQLATDCGFAHFMLVFEDHTAGTLTQFDFGPHNGADTHITLPGGKKRNRVVPGAVREAQLQKLPDCYLHVGQTALSLDDIRTFNQDQHLPYLLNVNDCRHYINRTVTFATGQENRRVCPALLRHKVLQRRTAQGGTRLRWQDRLIFWAHECTDVTHWPAVQAASQAACTLLGTLVGRRLWARAVRPSAVPRRLVRPTLAPAALPRARVPAVHRAVAALATAAQAPPARHTRRVGPLMREAARLGACARSGLHAAAVSAASTAGSLRRQGRGSASSLAAAAAGALRQATGRHPL